MDEVKLCDAPESNRAEIGPSELATKRRCKSKIGVSVCLVTLDRVALGGALHMLSYCVVVSACAVSCMVGCCTGVAAACAALYIVGYYASVTVLTISHATLGMLLQFGCCIQNAAAAAMAAPPKLPEAKSRGLVNLYLLFSFPKREPKRIFVLFGLS